MKWIILNLLILLLLFSTITGAIDLQKWMVNRAVYVNQKMINWHNRLSESDKMTHQQAINRIEAIINYAEMFNNMYSDIHPRRIAKDFFAVIETESSFVNFRSLDNGNSFGVTSMHWSTAKMIADKMGHSFNKNRLSTSPELQIKYAIWYYYHLLQHYNGDRMAALLSYNTGPGIDLNKDRWRGYYFIIYGRLKYYEDCWKKLRNKVDA